jgi:hypothetical protein
MGGGGGGGTPLGAWTWTQQVKDRAPGLLRGRARVYSTVRQMITRETGFVRKSYLENLVLHKGTF